MDLKDFVSQSLIQIVEGVVTASTVVSELGGAVSPSYSARREETLGHTNDGSGRPVQGVEFDVAVVASTEAASEASGGLRISVLSVGMKGSDKDSQQTTSRISFTVPLALPVDPKSADEAKKRSEEASRKLNATLRARGGSQSPW